MVIVGDLLTPCAPWHQLCAQDLSLPVSLATGAPVMLLASVKSLKTAVDVSFTSRVETPNTRGRLRVSSPAKSEEPANGWWQRPRHYRQTQHRWGR